MYKIVYLLLCLLVPLTSFAGEAYRSGTNMIPADRLGVIVYTAQPNDGDKITASGVVFEFDDNASVGGGNISVAIGGTADTTYATFLTEAIGESFYGRHDTAINKVTIGSIGFSSIEETIDTADSYNVGLVDTCTPMNVGLASEKGTIMSCSMGERFLINVPFFPGSTNSWTEKVEWSTASTETVTDHLFCISRDYCAAMTDASDTTEMVSTTADSVDLSSSANPGAYIRQWTSVSTATSVWDHGALGLCGEGVCERANVQCAYTRISCGSNDLAADVDVYRVQIQQNP